MRIALVIDSLGSGGAQRQLVQLGLFLRREGHEVYIFSYHEDSFFLSTLREGGIQHCSIRCNHRMRRVWRLRKELKRKSIDTVVSFLQSPNLIAELASLFRPGWGLIVSERNTYSYKSRVERTLRYLLHGIADHVTTNSHSNRILVEREAPWLRGRVDTIYNCVDLNYFSPGRERDDAYDLQLVGAGRYSEQKNLLRLIEALGIAKRERPELGISLEWYGDKYQRDRGGLGRKAPIFQEAESMIGSLDLLQCVALHDRTDRIRDVYLGGSALILPSVHEGLPNVVCEAMACGKPILISNVCDHANLVRDSWNGFLFDPRCPNDIAEKIVAFGELPPQERAEMGWRSRVMAEDLFDPGLFGRRYLGLVNTVYERGRAAGRCPHDS